MYLRFFSCVHASNTTCYLNFMSFFRRKGRAAPSPCLCVVPWRDSNVPSAILRLGPDPGPPKPPRLLFKFLPVSANY